VAEKRLSGKGLNKAKSRRKSHNEARGKYAKQHIRTMKNKVAARKAHLENNPNDINAKINIGNAINAANNIKVK
jgi:hypothetical protein